ncbi:MAG: hypothetical protein JRG76_04075 [Deltaproteobacteria bacterium]|nr:hypothetical protein [Deltaproteobacteria bacterium]MBW2413667.1 hypothetical protein [Deltaproteobacteria bacterium]
MKQTQRLDEMEFELALIGALEDLYGVNVRVQGDPLNRRRDGYSTLEFDYFSSEPGSDDVKVVVSIEGVPGASFSFNADFQDSESVMRAADDCENLALAVRESAGNSSVENAGPDRRWDD